MGEGLAPATLFRDHRIARLAIQPLPVWLWRADLTGLVWANAAGAACLQASTLQAAVAQRFSLTEPRLVQLVRIAGTLHPGGTPRLARLRGFAPGIGRAILCTVSRIVVEEIPAILVAGQAPAGIDLSLADRIAFLLTGSNEAMAAFAADGRLVAATPSGQAIIDRAGQASAIGSGRLAKSALADGAAAGDTACGRVSMVRVGDDDATALIAYFAAVPNEAASAEAGPQSRAVSEIVRPEVQPPSPGVDPLSPGWRPPLRFTWQMDQRGRFTLDSDEFTEVIGARTAVQLGRPWREIAAELNLDPANAVAQAIASRDPWSGIVVSFPIDSSGDRIRVELSGLPVYDRDRTFLGYRGFGVCRDVERLTQLGWVKRRPALPPTDRVAMTVISPGNGETASARRGSIDAADAILTLLHQTEGALSIGPELDCLEEKIADQSAPIGVTRPENVLLFPATAADAPSRAATAIAPVPTTLSVGEYDAFQEIARRLRARLAQGAPAHHGSSDTEIAAKHDGEMTGDAAVAPPVPADDRPASDLALFLDGLPFGLLVYRHGRALYANPAFLAANGFSGLNDLIAADGLDGLPADIDADAASGTGQIGQLVTINIGHSAKVPITARLIAVPWAEENALALVLLHQADESDHNAAAELALRQSEAQLRELRAIIDTTFDGLIVLSRDGLIISANNGAEVLFGYASSGLARRPFRDLFTPESRRAVLDDLDRARRGDGYMAGGREVIGQTRDGQSVPLSVVISRLPDSADKVYAIFRDLAPRKKAEAELLVERRDAERAVADQGDLLEKLSNGVRGAANSMTGVLDLMLEERFGPLGNERYRDCLRELHAASDHIGELVNNANSLSRAESGTLDLNFVPVDFNMLVKECIKILQADANRDRIIIRSALSPRLRPVLADAQSLQQVVGNLLANAIRHAGAGGQVIVSTGETERGHVVFRVRDTGSSGLKNPGSIEPRKGMESSPDHSRSASVDMVLTRTLTEANHGTLNVSSKARDGTLFEVSFPGARIPAE